MYLFPIDWPEPFGLTMVEAMACGTPVVAMDCGSVSEVVEDGVSGFIFRSFPELIDSVARARLLDRTACRAYVEARFSASAMADGYEEVYRQIATSCRKPQSVEVRKMQGSEPMWRQGVGGMRYVSAARTSPSIERGESDLVAQHGAVASDLPGAGNVVGRGSQRNAWAGTTPVSHYADIATHPRSR